MPFKTTEAKNEYARKWYAANKEAHGKLVAENNLKNRAWWPQFKASLACKTCGENHPACLDFHHREPSEQDFPIHQAIRRRWSKERIMAEIAKCDVLCANCHRKLHNPL